MKAIIPAAGLGTRFLPATKCTPKEMLPVLDKPVIQYVVEEALDPEEQMLELFYVRHASLALDMRIFVRTFKAMGRGQ